MPISQMHREACEAPQAVARQIAFLRDRLEALAWDLRRLRPRIVMTLARGSSDHAATFAKYLIETRLGLLTTSLAPSVHSIYDGALDLGGSLCLAISQSGRSPDLLRSAEAAKQGGAFVVALVNQPDSPLEAIADRTMPLCAGPETSVAATKSYLASLAALIGLVGAWADDGELKAQYENLPGGLSRALALDWRVLHDALVPARSLFVLGRGLALGPAQEAALKLKETCALHAEAFSGAEVEHGPMALVEADFPVLALSQDDETRPGMVDLAARLARRGAGVFIAGAAVEGAKSLDHISAHPAIEPLLMIQSFYPMAARLAASRGRDPDRPRHLTKVTNTL